MKALSIQSVIALALATMAWWHLDLEVWLAAAPGVMVSLSVIAAAILFRLGRGLPGFSVDELNVEDIRKLTSAYTAVAKRLGTILVLVGLAIGSVIAAYFVGETPLWVRPAVTSLGMFSLALVICRAVALVRGDLDLIRLQAKLLVQDARSRRAREQAEEIEDAQRTRPFRNPPGFGGLAS